MLAGHEKDCYRPDYKNKDKGFHTESKQIAEKKQGRDREKAIFRMKFFHDDLPAFSNILKLTTNTQGLSVQARPATFLYA